MNAIKLEKKGIIRSIFNREKWIDKIIFIGKNKYGGPRTAEFDRNGNIFGFSLFQSSKISKKK